MESDRKPGYEVLADVFAELEERIPGKGSRVLLVDSGVDEAALRAEGILRPPAAIEWLDTPRPTRDGPYERSSRPGDRRIGPHGTAMAAAILNIARGATISVLPVLNPEPEAPTSAEWISLGLQIAQGQKDSQLQPIINFSLAYLGDPRGEPYFLVANLDWAIEALQKRGALVVAAVGNNVPATVGLGWPARLSGVVAVGAVVERDGQFRRCPDSCYDPAATDDRDYFWVEEGGHLERGVVVSPGITVAGRKYAGSSVACARACGRLAAWRATQERLTGTAPPPDDMAQSLRQASMDGLEALAFPERGHGWARPVSSTNV